MELNALAAYAVSNVPAYRSIYAPGTLFSELDPISRFDVSGTEQSYVSPTIDSSTLLLTETSGSTGRPLLLRHTKSERTLAAMSLWRARRAHAPLSPNDAMCRFYGYTREERMRYGLAPLIRNGNLLQFSMFDMTESAMNSYIIAMNEHQPRWIQAMPSLIARLARFMLDEGLPGPGSVELIELTGEMLFDSDREIIQAAFNGSTIADRYAATEVWGIAYECPLGKLHTMTDNVHLELENTSKVMGGVEGDAIVTNIHFTSMPLLRYRLQDRILLCDDGCLCPNPGSVIKAVQGRSVEYAVGSSGEAVYPAFFNVAIAQANWQSSDAVRAFHAHQSGTNLRISLEPGSGWNHNSEEIIAAVLARKFSSRHLTLVLEPVPLVPGKKYQSFTRS